MVYAELWVEARAFSANLRDVVIEMEYGGAKETVKATAIWAELTQFRGTGQTWTVVPAAPNRNDVKQYYNAMEKATATQGRNQALGKNEVDRGRKSLT
jgi:hypothetical protein